MPIEAGLVLTQRYRLLHPLRESSQAKLWVAEHLALGNQVAVKLLDPALAKKDDARERFRREAMAAAQLRSPHVVQIVDNGIEGDQPFIVMELLEGEDLGERLRRCGRLSLGETSEIVTQIARALSRAHSAGIVHRDLKPGNIFLVPDEDHEIVKVLDFGVAKMSDGKPILGRAALGRLIGTPHYMSPEQIKGAAEVDFRTDLWAVGVIGFQCVTGKLPFDSENVGDLLVKITTAEVPVPSRVIPLPKSFDAWFQKSCSRSVDKRFTSAREQAEALARCVVGGWERRSTGARSGTIPPGHGGRPASVPPGATASRSPTMPGSPRIPNIRIDSVAGAEPQRGSTALGTGTAPPGGARVSTTPGAVRSPTSPGAVRTTTSSGASRASTTPGIARTSTSPGTARTATTPGATRSATTPGTTRPSTSPAPMRTSTSPGAARTSTSPGVVRTTTPGIARTSTTPGARIATPGPTPAGASPGAVRPSATPGRVNTTPGITRPGPAPGTTRIATPALPVMVRPGDPGAARIATPAPGAAKPAAPAARIPTPALPTGPDAAPAPRIVARYSTTPPPRPAASARPPGAASSVPPKPAASSLPPPLPTRAASQAETPAAAPVTDETPTPMVPAAKVLASAEAGLAEAERVSAGPRPTAPHERPTEPATAWPLERPTQQEATRAAPTAPIDEGSTDGEVVGPEDLIDEAPQSVEVVSSNLAGAAGPPDASDAAAMPDADAAARTAHEEPTAPPPRADVPPVAPTPIAAPPPPPSQRAPAAAIPAPPASRRAAPPPTIDPNPTPASLSVSGADLPDELDAGSRATRMKRFVAFAFAAAVVIIVVIVVASNLRVDKSTAGSNVVPAATAVATAQPTPTPTPTEAPPAQTVPASTASAEPVRALDPGTGADGRKVRAPGTPDSTAAPKPKPVGGGRRRSSGDDVEIVIPNADSE